jgi:hypothetical protein
LFRIYFPIIGDQPVAAASFELFLNGTATVILPLPFQVRSGEDGLKPLRLLGIEVRQTIDLCSEKWQEIRSNAEKLKVKFAKAWEDEDGAARQEIRKILHK